MATDTADAKVKDATKTAGAKPRKGKTKPRDPRPMPDVARIYIDDQAEAKTPMVFVTRDGDLVLGHVSDSGNASPALS